ncbi:MAG TPA: serine hydrolase domain-containing protein [Caulobacteraceae bacterium]|nr:serine hydrolase domain-containing protein [Caulobacteraceae bacterium]
MSNASADERLAQLLTPFTPDKPGLALLVTIGGETAFEQYLGGADLEHGAAVNAATRFHVASVSKQFTAFAAILESAAGRLDLDADIRRYLPELADYGAVVTVSDLAHHTGGVRDQWELMILSGTPIDGLIRQSAIVAMAAAQKGLNFPPGTDFRYSNAGYSLLAEIVARTSGKPFAAYLTDSVFEPLVMADTLVYGDASKTVHGRAMSYALGAGGEVKLARLNYSNYGATSLHTTPRDLAKWARELLHPSVFGRDVIARMTTPGRLRDGTPLNYGFGIMQDVLGGRPALTHGGADAGFRAAFNLFPADDASVIAFSNGQADVGVIAQALADACLGAAKAPEPTTPEGDRVAKLQGYYVSDWGPGLDLEARDGKLVRAAGGPTPLEAKFLTNGEFYFFAPSNGMSERPNGDLVERQGVGGLQLVYRRTDRATPTAADLQPLVGRYRSDEIDTTYTLAVASGEIILSSLRSSPIKLVPADKDSFDGPWLRLTVARDAGGAPTGFTVSTGRVRSLAFQRID